MDDVDDPALFVADASFGSLFLIPGIGETLRINGRVAAVMPAVRFKQLGRIISITLQPSLLEAGDNTLEFYALDRQDTAPYTFLKLNMLGAGIISGDFTVF